MSKPSQMVAAEPMQNTPPGGTGGAVTRSWVTRRLRRVAETPARSAESVTVTRRWRPLGVEAMSADGADQVTPSADERSE